MHFRILFWLKGKEIYYNFTILEFYYMVGCLHIMSKHVIYNAVIPKQSDSFAALMISSSCLLDRCLGEESFNSA